MKRKRIWSKGLCRDLVHSPVGACIGGKRSVLELLCIQIFQLWGFWSINKVHLEFGVRFEVATSDLGLLGP